MDQPITEITTSAGKSTREFPKYEALALVMSVFISEGLGRINGPSSDTLIFLFTVLAVIALVLAQTLLIASIWYVLSDNTFKYNFLSSLRLLLIFYSFLIIGSGFYELFLNAGISP
jgi:hypothetical protein